jgi:tetratricopeptide (TPR) repeat protein
MEKVYAALPDDAEAAAFFALAHLATTPSNVISRAHADRAAEILVRVYQRFPDHPGAMHYLVHANDVPGREKELLEVTQKYESIAPRNPHALHMPTHIYTRLGDWKAVIGGNLRAAEAALEYPAGANGEYVWDEFAHAIEYLVYAYLQKGADESAAAQLKRMQEAVRLEPTFKTAFHLASSQARYALERRDWKAAAALVPREPATLNWDRFAWAEATVQFAHGFGAARTAAQLEASTPKHAVTPGPTLPANELLGDLFMEQNQPAEALAAYRRSLELYPKRFNSLLGAARAARKNGDRPAALSYYRELLQVAEGTTREAALKEARKFVS